MKKKVFSFLIFILSMQQLSAQGNIEGGLYGEYFGLGDKGFQDLGIMFHFPFAERFTANYHVGFGSSNSGGVFVHAPSGAFAGAFVLYAVDRAGGGRLGLLGFLLCAVPEGVGYYLPTKGKLSTHISVNPLSVEYFHKVDSGEEWGKMSCNVVARFKMSPNMKIPIYVAPQVAGTIIYTPGQTTSRYGFRAGVTIGLEKKTE